MLVLRKENRSKTLEARMLRRTFGVNEQERTQKAKKMHNLELHNLYSSPGSRVLEDTMRCF